MRLQHILEDVIRREGKDDAQQEGAHRNGQGQVFVPIGLVKQKGQSAYREGKHHIDGLHLGQEAPEIRGRFSLLRHPDAVVEVVDMAFDQGAGLVQDGRQEGGEGREAQAPEKGAPGMRHRTGNQVKNHQDGNESHHRPVGAQGKGRDKERHHQAEEPQPPAGEAFPVEDKHKAQIDQGTASLAFRHDDEHGQNDDGGRQGQVLELGQAEVLHAHHEGEQQRGGYLGNLCRLEADGPQVEPRVGTLDVTGHEDNHHQQPQHQDVKGDADALPQARGQQEEDGSGQPQGSKNPHELFSGAGTPVKDGSGVCGVDGGIDIEPADEHQQEVGHDDGPVDRLSFMCLLLSHV